MSTLGQRAALLFVALLLWPLGCTQQNVRPSANEQAPVVRVRVLENQQSVTLSAPHPPRARLSSQGQVRRLNFANSGSGVPLPLNTAGAWQIGPATLGPGELLIAPAADGTVRVNGKA